MADPSGARREGQVEVDGAAFERVAARLDALRDDLDPAEGAVLSAILLLAETGLEESRDPQLELGEEERGHRLLIDDADAFRSSMEATVGRLVRQPRFGRSAQRTMVAWMDRNDDRLG